MAMVTTGYLYLIVWSILTTLGVLAIGMYVYDLDTLMLFFTVMLTVSFNAMGMMFFQRIIKVVNWRKSKEAEEKKNAFYPISNFENPYVFDPSEGIND